MPKIRRSGPAGAARLIALAAACLAVASMPVSAAVQFSPPVRIVGLELRDGTGVLEIAVQVRTFAPGEYDFNPASCGDSRSFFTRSGSSGAIESYDFILNMSERTAVKQHQVLNQVYAAFATSRMVRLAVYDDQCTSSGRPIVAGLLVQH